MNLNPNIWGPVMWFVLVNLTLMYPDDFNWESAKQFKYLLGQLGYVLPCENCKVHYITFTRLNPPDTNSKLSVLQWLNALYNYIAEDNNTPNKKLSFDQFVRKFGSTRYNKKYFWQMLYYIVEGYPESNADVSFDMQLQYRQFLVYLFDMNPLRHIKYIFVDNYLLNKRTFKVWYDLERSQLE